MPMVHDFWLLRESERLYKDHYDLIRRRDAPVRLHDDFMFYFYDSLLWIPTLNPSKPEGSVGCGLNGYGSTIINQTGGLLWSQIWSSWAQLFTHGPEQLRLQGEYSWQWPFDESEHLVSEDQLGTFGRYEYVEIDRDELVRVLTLLAQFGEQAATGEFFIFHVGI